MLIARIPDVKLQEAALEHVSLDPRTEEPLSYRDAEDYIHNEFMLRLADAPFSTKDATLVPGVSSCRECPLRTGNQEELFADVGSKDVCTSPPCYHSKVEAHLRKIAEKEDADVLTVAKAQKVFGKYGTPTGGFIDLDRTDWRLSDSGKKVRELVGGEAKKVLAFSGGKVHELVREKDLPDRLKKKIETAKSRTSLQSNTISPEKKKEIERERAAAEAVSEAVRAAAVAAVLDPKRKLKLDALLMPLAAAVSVDREWYFCREVLPRLGVSKKKKPDAVIRTQASEIIATVKKMTAAQQMAVLVELLFFTSEYGDPEDLAAARDELLKSLAVDEDAVCGRVEAELKSKWAAEDAKEKSAPVAAAKKVDPAKKQKPAAAATGKKTAGGKKK
ncbi:MAG TPA: hypothetical protein VHU41_15905 [Thermoanaerobaculia bacterium]|nr:hypothetical protein [Thermoanaerobaculia bacterium]